MLTEYGSTLYSERTDSISLFLLNTLRIQNAYTTNCEIFQDEKYFSRNAQPPPALPAIRLTRKVAFIS
jgi:hypothetical protein